MGKMTQIEKVVEHMIQGWPAKLWWYAPDFMPPRLDFSHPHFVGYEATARISDLIREYPGLFESQRSGKYREVKIRMDQIYLVAGALGDTDFGRFLRTMIEKHKIPRPSPAEMVPGKLF